MIVNRHMLEHVSYFCPRRLVECPDKCGVSVRVHKLKLHQLYCPMRKIGCDPDCTICAKPMHAWFYREHLGPGTSRGTRRGKYAKRNGNQQQGDAGGALPRLLEDGTDIEEDNYEEEDDEDGEEPYEDEHGVNDGALWAPDEEEEEDIDDHALADGEEPDTNKKKSNIRRNADDILSVGSSDSQPFYKNMRKGLEYVHGKRRPVKKKTIPPNMIRDPKYIDPSEVESVDSASTHSSFTDAGPYKKVSYSTCMYVHTRIYLLIILYIYHVYYVYICVPHNYFSEWTAYIPSWTWSLATQRSPRQSITNAWLSGTRNHCSDGRYTTKRTSS